MLRHQVVDVLRPVVVVLLLVQEDGPRVLLPAEDEIGLTLALEPKISAFQAADRQRRPWIYG